MASKKIPMIPGVRKSTPPTTTPPTTTTPINPLTGKPYGGGTTSTGSTSPTTTIPPIVEDAQNKYDAAIADAAKLGIDPQTGKPITTAPKPITTTTGQTGINPLTGKPYGGATSTPGTKKPEPGGWKGLWKDIADVTIDPIGRVGSSTLQWIVKQPLPTTNPMYNYTVDPETGQLKQKTVADALDTVDVGKRIVVSSVKEVTDAINGGDADWGDWANQITDASFGFGSAFPDPTGIKWVDRGIGFAGDFVLDPLNWVVPFSGVAAEQAIRAGTVLATKESAKILVDYTAKGIIRKGLTDAELAAFALADDGYRIANDALVGARATGQAPDVISGLEAAAKSAEDEVIRIGQETAMKAGTRGGKILSIAEQRAKASEEWLVALANDAGDDVIETAANKLVNLNRELSQANIGRYGARRTYRGYAREDLAERARLFAEKAKQTAVDLREQGGRIGPDELRALDIAEQIGKILTPDKIADIATRGYNALYDDAGKLLGVTSGFRTVGGGRATQFIESLVSGKKIPGTNIKTPRLPGGKRIGGDKLAEAIGGAVVEGRLWFVNTSTGRRFLDSMTPLGRRGLFGDADSLTMRKALRSGAVTGQEAQDYVQLLSANKRYLSLVAAAKRTNGTLLKNAINNITPEQWAELDEMLKTGKNVTRDANGDFMFAPSVSNVIREKYVEIRNLLDNWYNETNNFHNKYGGTRLGYVEDYFPRVSSNEAIEWAAKNEEAAVRVADFLGVDRAYLTDNFVERVLVRGKRWFGHILEGNETADQLNSMARNAINGEKSLKFDFFETDSAKVLARYGETHSRNMAYLNTLESMLQEPGGAVRGLGDLFVEPSTPTSVRESLQDLAVEIEERLGLDPVTGVTKMGSWSRFQLESILNDLEEVVKIFDGSRTQFPMELDVNEVVSELESLRNRVVQIDEGIKNGVLDAKAGALGLDELMSYAAQIGGALGPGSGGQIDIIMDTFRDYVVNNPDGFVAITRMFEDGFSNLGFRNLPEIAARNEVASMFSNIQKLTNRQFASSAERVIGDVNTFFKSWATATPGFHLRNSLSNTFQMIAAGVDLTNALEGIKYYNAYWRANVRRGRFISPEEFVAGLKNVSPVTRRNIRAALESIDDSGLIQDYLQTGKIGFSGKTVREGRTSRILARTGLISESRALLPRTRQAAGLPLQASRGVGELVENTNRFLFTFDGLVKGNSIEEALGRTNKYLFDYADLTKTDRVIKQIIPFWIWTSRNLPLQLENLFTNPRLYANYNKVMDVLAADEQDPNMPWYKRKAGVINLTPGIANITSQIPLIGGTEFAPQFGFPGGGPVDQITQLIGFPSAVIDATLNGNMTGLQEILRSWIGSVTPLPKVGLELATGSTVFRGKPIANKYLPITEGRQQFNYTVGQLFQPGQTLGNLAQMFGVDWPTNINQRQILGMPLPQTGITEEAKAEQARIDAERLVGQYFGSPFTTTTPQQQAAELNRKRAIVEEFLRVEKEKRDREANR